MARYPVASGAIANAPMSVIVDTQGQTKGILLQNVSPTDVFVSDDPSVLQNVNNVGLPTSGLHFPPDTAGITPFILCIPKFNGKLYARAQNPLGAMETIIYEPC